MNIPDEKANTLSRCGSFYYQTLVDDSKEEAEFMSHLTWQTKVFDQIQRIQTLISGKSYYIDFYKVFKFKDSDIDWNGVKESLQFRNLAPSVIAKKNYQPASKALKINNPDYFDQAFPGRPAVLSVSDVFLAETDKDMVVADNKENAILFPGGGDNADLNNFDLYWTLKINKNILISSIKKDDGSLLLMNQDFISQYGYVTFFENPIKLFPKMQFFAESFIVRVPNLYNYMLQLSNVYGDVTNVIAYYRNKQTPNAFYYAAAQAAGFAVVNKNCKILFSTPLYNGCSYFTTAGRFDAPYLHKELQSNTEVSAGTVIGGKDLFVMCGPDDTIPNSIDRISLDGAIPINGLYAPNADITFDADYNYTPLYLGDTAALNAFKQYNKQMPEVEKPIADTVNGIQYFRQTACKGKTIVVCINESFIEKDMRLRLLEFIDRERPAGSVVVYAKLFTDDNWSYIQPAQLKYGLNFNNINSNSGIIFSNTSSSPGNGILSNAKTAGYNNYYYLAENNYAHSVHENTFLFSSISDLATSKGITLTTDIIFKTDTVITNKDIFSFAINTQNGLIQYKLVLDDTQGNIGLRSDITDVTTTIMHVSVPRELTNDQYNIQLIITDKYWKLYAFLKDGTLLDFTKETYDTSTFLSKGSISTVRGAGLFDQHTGADYAMDNFSIYDSEITTAEQQNIAKSFNTLQTPLYI